MSGFQSSPEPCLVAKLDSVQLCVVNCSMFLLKDFFSKFQRNVSPLGEKKKKDSGNNSTAQVIATGLDTTLHGCILGTWQQPQSHTLGHTCRGKIDNMSKSSHSQCPYRELEARARAEGSEGLNQVEGRKAL